MKKIFFVFLLLTFLGLLLFSLFEVNRVSGSAMEPTLKSGQLVIFRKFGVHNPQRGDIVLYKNKDQQDFIGRVIALPTESVRIENGNLYLDNNPGQYQVKEEYLASGTQTVAYEEGKWTKIGEFEYLVLMDKRQNVISVPARLINRNNINGVLFLKF